MVRFIVAALAAVFFAAPAVAQTYPSKPIRLIVPFPPGGGTDSVSRLVAQELQKSTGWTIVVENKAGAGGMIGLQEAARARNDGYDIVMGQVDNMVIAPAVQRTGQLDPIKELTPVIQVASSPFLFMSAADSKYRTLNDWVSEAKANAGKISYGTRATARSRTSPSSSCRRPATFTAVQVPTRARAPAITDLLGRPHSDGGAVDRIRHAAHSGRQGARPRRHVCDAQPGAADVPTVAESGFPGFESERLARDPGAERHAARRDRKLNAEIAKVMHKRAR
jgi:tripartite-type tricarboxylate transporter receptor subunit TctC